MKIQHAAFIGSASPYIRVVKFSDDIGETMTLPFASPVALSCAAFSPDGKLLVAGLTASSTASLRMWKRSTAISDDWEEVTGITALPSAKAIYDLVFTSDTQFAISAPSQVWVVDVDRTTHALTFTSLDTSDRGTSRKLSVMPNKKVLFVANGKWNTSAAGLASYYLNGSTWTAFSNGSFSSYVNAITPFSGGGVLAHVATGAMLRGFKLTADATPPVYTASSVVQVASGDAVTYDGVTAGVYNSRIAVSPDGLMALIPMFATPYAALRRILDYKTPAYWMDTVAPTFPALAANLNDVRSLDIGIFLLATSSATITTGRARGFRYNGPDASLTEIDAISDLFDNWNASILSIGISEPITVTAAPAQFYNSSVEALLEGGVDLTNLKIALMTDAAIFNAAHTTLTQVLGSDEAYGSSWPQGGVPTNDATYLPTGVGAETALRLTIPPTDMAAAGTFTFRKAVIYDDTHTDKRPLVFLTFNEDKVVVQNDRMQFTSAASRLAIFTPDA